MITYVGIFGGEWSRLKNVNFPRIAGSNLEKLQTK